MNHRYFIQGFAAILLLSFSHPSQNRAQDIQFEPLVPVDDCQLVDQDCLLNCELDCNDEYRQKRREAWEDAGYQDTLNEFQEEYWDLFDQLTNELEDLPAICQGKEGNDLHACLVFHCDVQHPSPGCQQINHIYTQYLNFVDWLNLHFELNVGWRLKKGLDECLLGCPNQCAFPLAQVPQVCDAVIGSASLATPAAN